MNRNMNGAGATINIFISYFLWPGRMFVAPVLASLLCLTLLFCAMSLVLLLYG